MTRQVLNPVGMSEYEPEYDENYDSDVQLANVLIREVLEQTESDKE